MSPDKAVQGDVNITATRFGAISGTLYGIQHLRFIAAMMVVVTHASGSIARLYPDWIVAHWTPGGAGVDIFFVISGFIMVLITRDGPPSPVGFWLGRVFRIVPLYWSVTLLAFLLGMLAPVYFYGRATGADLLQSLFFIRLENTLIIVRPGWTLNLEMAFYLMLSIALFAKRAYIFVILLALFSFYCVATILSDASLALAFYAFNGFMLEFALGILLALAIQSDHRIPPVWGIAIAILGFVLLHFMWPYASTISRFLVCGVPAFLIVGGTVLMEPYCRGPLSVRLSLLGDASYAIYLTHTVFVTSPINRLAVRNEEWVHTHVPPAVLTALLFSMPILVGLATHLFFERPVAAWIRRRRRGASRAEIAAAAIPTR